MQNFVFHTPTKVYFGKDEELKVGKIIKEYGAKKVLIHFGSKSAKESGLLDRVENCLREENIEYIEFGGVQPNPELKLVRKGIELCIKENVDFILAVGGGSVIDSAKDIANGAANPEVDVWEFSKKRWPFTTLERWCIVSVLAGGLGNMIDRLRLGYVVDMIETEFMNFPVFNVADCFITCGCILLLIHLFLFNKEFWKEEKK